METHIIAFPQQWLEGVLPDDAVSLTRVLDQVIERCKARLAQPMMHDAPANGREAEA